MKDTSKSGNRHKIFEPKMLDILSNIPEYKKVKKYERMEKDFIDEFVNLFSDEMYFTKPSDDLREKQMNKKLEELFTKIKYKFYEKYKV